jgi:soluble lytic murein transglycosylase
MTLLPLAADLAAVKNAINLARKAKTSEATAIQKTIGDTAARKVVEWFILRYPYADANFSRYAAFIADCPGWPS